VSFPRQATLPTPGVEIFHLLLDTYANAHKIPYMHPSGSYVYSKSQIFSQSPLFDDRKVARLCRTPVKDAMTSKW